MATRRYKVNVGEGIKDVVEEVGAAVNSDAVELTVEMANTAVNAGGSTRQITQVEVIEALDKIKAHILSKQFPPV